MDNSQREKLNEILKNNDDFIDNTERVSTMEKLIIETDNIYNWDDFDPICIFYGDNISYLNNVFRPINYSCNATPNNQFRINTCMHDPEIGVL